MNALFAYLAKIDPEFLIAVVSAVWVGGKWVFHKIKGDQTTSLKETLWPSVEGVIIKLAESEFVVSVVREKLTKAAYEALARAGLKRNAFVDGIVNQLVDTGVTEVRKRVEARKAVAELPARMDAMVTAAQKVADAFKPPTNPTVPVIGEGLPGEFQVEIVKPEPQGA